MSNQPLVSICIPSYNHEAYIEEAINSAINQTYGNIEVIIIDDASTDGSQRIISKYTGKSRVGKIILRKENSGMTKNFNDCIKESRGEYILLMGSDDILIPDLIEKEIKLFKKSSAGIIHSGISWINEEGNAIKSFINENKLLGKKQKIEVSDVNEKAKKIDSVKFGKREVIKLLIKKGSPVTPSTCLISGKCFEEVGLFDENLMFQDYEFWFRALKKFDILYLDNNLAKYRVHSTNVSKSEHYLDAIKKFEEMIKLFEKINFDDKHLNNLKKATINGYKKMLKKHRELRRKSG